MERKDKSEINRFKLFVRRVESITAKTTTAQYKKRARIFNDFVSTISPLYEESLKGSKAMLTSMCKQYPHLFSLTSFELMGRQTLEETHSNVIAYLLNQKEIGKPLLKALLQGIEDKYKTSIVRKLAKEDFEVTREYPLGKKEIDIFIKGKSFIVVIENKFLAGKHYVNESQSQTDFYKEEVTRKYPNKEKIFLILDYKGTIASEGYHTLNYSDLDRALSIIKKQAPLGGHEQILTDYLYLVKRLIYGINNIEANGIKNLNSLTQLTNIQMEAKEWNFQLDYPNLTL